MSNTTLVWTSQQTPVNDMVDRLGSGYQLSITITDSFLIDPNVFVFRRDPVTPGSTDYEDAFLTVASVAYIADLAVGNPADGSNEYRASSVAMFFHCLDDLNFALIDIQDAMKALCVANDIANTLSASATEFYPPGSYNRFWGFNGSDTVTNDQVLAFSQAPGTTRPASVSINIGTSTVYLFMLYRAELGDGTFTLNSSPVSMTKTTQSVTNATGYVASYFCYCTAAPVTGLGTPVTLAVT